MGGSSCIMGGAFRAEPYPEYLEVYAPPAEYWDELYLVEGWGGLVVVVPS